MQKKTKPSHAFKTYASFYNVEILNYFNSELQFKGTESGNWNKLRDLLTELKGFEYVTTLILEFKKMQTDNLHSKAEIIINESDIDDELESIYSTNV